MAYHVFFASARSGFTPVPRILMIFDNVSNQNGAPSDSAKAVTNQPPSFVSTVKDHGTDGWAFLSGQPPVHLLWGALSSALCEGRNKCVNKMFTLPEHGHSFPPSVVLLSGPSNDLARPPEVALRSRLEPF